MVSLSTMKAGTALTLVKN